MTKSFKPSINISGRKIGPNSPPYIIAELSANHNGSIESALKTIKMAKEMGADAVKIQSYSPDTMTIDCNNDYFKINGGLWDGYNLYELYDWAQTPFDWHKKLFSYAKEIGITIFSTPFDETAVELLEDLNCPAYKIASFEATDLTLIKKVASTGKPLIVSTGMANEKEINDIVETAKHAGCSELILLHCISAYPAPIQQSNLATIADISRRWNVLSGLSDHSLGTDVSTAAIAVGACVIEKHVTLTREEPGPDSAFSIEPNELKELVSKSNLTWQSLGTASYERKPAEEENLKFRRSLFFVKDIKEGTIITPEHVRRIRPGYGLAPKYEDQVLGKLATKDIQRGTPVSWELLK